MMIIHHTHDNISAMNVIVNCEWKMNDSHVNQPCISSDFNWWDRPVNSFNWMMVAAAVAQRRLKWVQLLVLIYDRDMFSIYPQQHEMCYCCFFLLHICMCVESITLRDLGRFLNSLTSFPLNSFSRVAFIFGRIASLWHFCFIQYAWFFGLCQWENA